MFIDNKTYGFVFSHQFHPILFDFWKLVFKRVRLLPMILFAGEISWLIVLHFLKRKPSFFREVAMAENRHLVWYLAQYCVIRWFVGMNNANCFFFQSLTRTVRLACFCLRQRYGFFCSVGNDLLNHGSGMP